MVEFRADASFWISCVAVLVVGAATVWAYAKLATVARNAREHEPALEDVL